MVNVNMEDLSKYLTVSKEKLREAFGEVYGLPVNICEIEDLNEKEIKERTMHFASWDWIFGKKLDFQYELSHRFSWGEVVLQMKVKDGRIKEANVYSDAMKPDLILAVKKYLRNIRYERNAICAELGLYWSEDREEEQMMKEIIAWIRIVDL